ncbi:hypothetical protein M407DRAFT_243559 [Tulasnella calospora MUT 4182]|uniref:Uncharacterized protein n=1 Tax=Tulasnella calospora MUT 4182 TaxID=1051891 RepID=A0A0C3QKD6_9AGAM|nr:hypothetical protein M407DRAFT_243559 [Tulasnella calospora MUT 4182]
MIICPQARDTRRGQLMLDGPLSSPCYRLDLSEVHYLPAFHRPKCFVLIVHQVDGSANQRSTCAHMTTPEHSFRNHHSKIQQPKSRKGVCIIRSSRPPRCLMTRFRARLQAVPTCEPASASMLVTAGSMQR